MHRRIYLALVGSLIAAISLTAGASAGVQELAGSSSPAGAEQRQGGTVVFGQDQEPRTLNTWVLEGNLFATTEVYSSLMDSGMRFNNRAALVPMLLDGRPQIIRQNPFTVRFRYKQAAKWSDGTQITARDFRALWQTIMAREGQNFRWDIVSRVGWEDIRAVQGNGKVVTVVFTKPYAIWDGLVGSGPIPAHAVAGENFNQLWRNNILNKAGRPVGSGPYILTNWQRGQQIVLARNPNYWGQRAFLNQIIYRQIPNTQTQFQALRAGEVSVLRPQFQLAVAEIMRDNRFNVQMGPEYVWEHLDFQMGANGHPALKRQFVRRAIALGINRQQVANNLFRPVVNRLPVLQNVFFKNFEPRYRNNWGAGPNRIAFSQRNAIALLRRNNCTGGPATPRANNRDIYSCPGVGRLEFDYTTNMGVNERRALMFQIVRQQLLSIGIQLNADVIPSLAPKITNGDYNGIANFAWVGSPTTWVTSVNIYGCGRPQNWMRYCNAQVTRQLDRITSITDPAQQTRILNNVDSILARDVPTLPMFAAPGFAINRTNVRNVLRNPTNASLFWNSGTWYLQ
jgi:peptide/nickel transport system substrate-binding protein